MELVSDEAGLLPMRDDESPPEGGRAAWARRERMELGFSQRDLAKQAEELGLSKGLSRDAIMAAEAGTASPDTYDRLKVLFNRLKGIRDQAGPEALSDLEGDDSDDDIEVTDVGNGTVELHAKIGGDVDIIAKGPVASLPELTASIRELVREQRAPRKPDAD